MEVDGTVRVAVVSMRTDWSGVVVVVVPVRDGSFVGTAACR
jgi:hypothetical protein